MHCNTELTKQVLH